MLYSILFSLLLSSLFIAPLMRTPLSIGLLILLIAILTTALITIISSPWFALILFIIYIRGILVIFSYFSAIAPNQKIRISIILLLFIPTFILIFLNFNLPFQTHTILIKASTPIKASYFLTPDQRVLIIALALILLLALIFVVKIARRNIGPLRPFI